MPPNHIVLWSRFWDRDSVGEILGARENCRRRSRRNRLSFGDRWDHPFSKHVDKPLLLPIDVVQ